MQKKKITFEKWLEYSNLRKSQTNSKRASSFIEQSERQLQNLEILIEEKQELEKKVEIQNEQNEQIQAEIDQIQI